MSSIRSIFLAAVISFALSDRSFSQQYQTAIGLKVGNMAVIEYKKFFSDNLAMDISSGIYLVDYPGLFTNIVFQYHHNFKPENFRWFYGAGIGTRIGRFDRNEIGLAGSIGMEFSVPEVSLAFSIGFQPVMFIELGNLFQEYYLTGPATVGVKYLLN